MILRRTGRFADAALAGYAGWARRQGRKGPLVVWLSWMVIVILLRRRPSHPSRGLRDERVVGPHQVVPRISAHSPLPRYHQEGVIGLPVRIWTENSCQSSQPSAGLTCK